MLCGCRVVVCCFDPSEWQIEDWGGRRIRFAAFAFPPVSYIGRFSRNGKALGTVGLKILYRLSVARFLPSTDSNERDDG